MRIVTRSVVMSMIATAGMFGAFAGTAHAAQPAVQACVGTTLSTAAHAPGPLGQGVKTFAQDPNTAKPGLGDGIQLLQSGGLPQDVVPNTCNTSS